MELSKLVPPAAQAADWNKIVTGFQKFSEVSAKVAKEAASGRISEATALVPSGKRPPRIASEAIGHGLFELAFHHAARGKAEELLHLAPIATYLTLAPFSGQLTPPARQDPTDAVDCFD